MRRLIATLLLIATPCLGAADAVLRAAVDDHILPGFETLVEKTAALETACAEACAADDPALRAAYGEAFDAWIRVSHLRFGPTEANNLGFALAFWPDSRGTTQKTLARLLSAEDPVIEDPDAFARASVAGRGFYALERLLYDDALPGEAAYRTALTAAVIADMARTASVIATAWRDRYADTLATAGEADNDVYLSADEGRRDLFTALSTGLQTTAELRLGRPLGSFERPRPKRAEARRSGRSLRHVVLSLEASRALAAILATGAPEELRGAVDAPFARALDSAADLDDPVFAGVADPVGRIRIEALQLRVNETRRAVALSLGPHLGIAAGFNSLDGD